MKNSLIRKKVLRVLSQRTGAHREDCNIPKNECETAPSLQLKGTLYFS